MSMANVPGQRPSSSPLTIKARRTAMACSNCRTAKIKCKPPSETPSQPCARCTSKGLACEYFPVAEQADFTPRVNTTKKTSPRNSAPPPPPSLPYTGPPPFNQRPRYAGQPLPDLSLAGAQPPPAWNAGRDSIDARYGSGPYLNQQYPYGQNDFNAGAGLPIATPSFQFVSAPANIHPAQQQYPFAPAPPSHQYPAGYNLTQQILFDPAYGGYAQDPAGSTQRHHYRS